MPQARKKSAPKRHGEIYGRILEFTPSKSDLRKIAILDAVIDCISSEGVRNLTSQAVGKRAKMRRSHIVYYFPNQEDMVLSAIKFAVSVGQDVLLAGLKDAPDAPEKKLEAYVHFTFQWLRDNPKHAAVMNLLHYYATVSKEYRAIHDRIVSGAEERIASVLLAKKKGNSVEAKKAARTIRATLVGSLVTQFSTDPEVSLDDCEAITTKAILSIADNFWS